MKQDKKKAITLSVILTTIIIVVLFLLLRSCSQQKDIQVEDNKGTEPVQEVIDDGSKKEETVEEEPSKEEDITTITVEEKDNSTLSYYVSFLNKDGSLLSRSIYKYGSTPTAPLNPTYSDGIYYYSFTGWNKTISKVTGTQVYTAQYEIIGRVSNDNGDSGSSTSNEPKLIYNESSDFKVDSSGKGTKEIARGCETTLSTIHIGNIPLTDVYKSGDDYTGVYVKDESRDLVENTDYTVTSGSVKVNLTSTYLNSLSTGSHTINVYVNHSAEASSTSKDYEFDVTITVKEPYEKLAYIESSGTQYINTKLTPGSGYSVKMKVQFTDDAKEHVNGLFGLNSDNAKKEAFFRVQELKNKKYSFWANGQGSSTDYSYTFNAYTDYVIEAKFATSSTLKVNGATIRTINNNGAYFLNKEIPLLAVYMYNSKNVWQTLNYAYCRLYECQMFDSSGKQTRNYIPCILTTAIPDGMCADSTLAHSIGAVGMWDTTNNKFYTNAGTSTFTYGHLVDSISLNKSSTTIKVGSTETLTTTVLPSDATDKTVTWSSSDPSVATVSDGTITALKAGTTTITATAADGSGVKATCTVTVYGYTVTLDANGGTAGTTASVIAIKDDDMPVIDSTALPTGTNLVFQGYYDAAIGGTQYYKADGTSAKTWDKESDTTLYAQWKVSYLLDRTDTVNTSNHVTRTLTSDALLESSTVEYTYGGKTCIAYNGFNTSTANSTWADTEAFISALNAAKIAPSGKTYGTDGSWRIINSQAEGQTWQGSNGNGYGGLQCYWLYSGTVYNTQSKGTNSEVATNSRAHIGYVVVWQQN